MGGTERIDDVATNHAPEEPWWMFFLWPWSKTYGQNQYPFMSRVSWAVIAWLVVLLIAWGIGSIVRAF